MAGRKLIRAIGVLESCFKEKFGTPRQPQLVPSSRARLKIKKEFVPEQSLKGLSEFSHVWLLSYFHLNTNKIFLSTVHPPRLKGKTVGAFASRSPHRPSPIGLSLARLLEIQGDTLLLSEIDLVDGTPILDIKPYIPAYDNVPSARGGWTERVEPRELKVEFEAAALAEVEKCERRCPGLERLIVEVLRQDLRNPRDRSQMKDGKPLEFFVHDFDVRYEARGNVARVTGIEPAKAFNKAKAVRVPAELD